MGWLRRFGTTIWRSRGEDDFVDEMRFHLERRAEEYIEGGMTPEQARREALRRFGNAAAIRERTRDADTLRFLTDLGTDVRYGMRTLGRNPGFALVAVLTLALGIGASTAIFAAAYGVLLRPLPYPDSRRLVRLSEYHEGATSPLREAFLSDMTYDAWRRATRTLTGLAAYAERAFTVTGVGDADRVRATAVSPEIFGVLGLPPAAGRYFTSEEAVQGADQVVVLGHGYWQQRFAGRADAIGQTLTLDGRPRVIVGIAPEGFSFPDADRQLFTPLVPPGRSGQGTNQRVNVFLVVGRLAPGVSVDQAAAEGTAIARGLGPRPMAADLLFGKGGPVTVRVRSSVDQMTTAVRPILLLLVVGVALVLLLGCANVANLLLSLGVTRERELALRAAIGAGRGRLLRQLLAESVALSTTAALVGLVLAWALVGAWPAIVPTGFPRASAVQLDWTPLLFAVATSLAASVLVGLAPALHGSRVSLESGLHDARGASMSQRSRRTRQALLILQAAFAVVLVVGAALLIRSFDRLVNRDSGYDPSNVLTARVTVPAAGRWQDLATALVARLETMLGVQSVGVSNMAPLGDSTMIAGFRLARDRPNAEIARGLGYVVTPGYLEALRLRLVEGRLLNASDTTAPTSPMIVNEAFARTYFDDGRPVVGRRYPDILKPGGEAEIVGVVGNVLMNGLTDTAQPEFYVALGNQGNLAIGREMYLVMRTSQTAADVAPTLRSLVRELEPAAPVHGVRDLAPEVADTAGDSRFAATSVAAFAAIALGLAAIGLYGGLMYAVSRRTREMGIRTALGASPANLVRLVVREGVVVTGAGLILGWGAAMLLTRIMRGVLFGIDPLDVLSFTVAPALLIVVASAACLLPAWRAVSIAPVDALRQE